MTVAVNRYAGVDLYMQEEIHRIVRDRTGAGKMFDRQIDAWWLGLCIGVRKGERISLSPDTRTVKFIDGTVLGSDPWRITHLELLALATEGDRALEQPRRVMGIAMEYANFGLEWLRDECLLKVEPTLSLLNRLDLSTLFKDS
ncbi:hypothetical protein [Streptomyces erythrochromogenes]|uniref:hypothetical protein n=1 Tax=Streptomyces erythrochromogenes TaxID=285574 RepID=UPI0036999D57